MENTPNQERKFVSLDNVSKFLYCSICDDIFRNPIRLKSCGHTFCLDCKNSNNFKAECTYEEWKQKRKEESRRKKNGK